MTPQQESVMKDISGDWINHDEMLALCPSVNWGHDSYFMIIEPSISRFYPKTYIWVAIDGRIYYYEDCGSVVLSMIFSKSLDAKMYLKRKRLANFK